MATKLEHPSWCDPTFCDAPTETPITYNPAQGTRHHSNPVELARSGSLMFTLPFSLSNTLHAAERGVWAWLTQAVAPWKCATYLRVGLWNPGSVPPEELFSLEMNPAHMTDPSQPLSGGERLRHLCTFALSEQKAQAARTLEELLATRDRPFTTVKQ